MQNKKKIERREKPLLINCKNKYKPKKFYLKRQTDKSRHGQLQKM